MLISENKIRKIIRKVLKEEKDVIEMHKQGVYNSKKGDGVKTSRYLKFTTGNQAIVIDEKGIFYSRKKGSGNSYKVVKDNDILVACIDTVLEKFKKDKFVAMVKDSLEKTKTKAREEIKNIEKQNKFSKAPKRSDGYVEHPDPVIRGDEYPPEDLKDKNVKFKKNGNFNNPESFVKKYGQVVIDSCQGTNILPSIKLAQMALESNFGSSRIANIGNNFFGIKAGAHYNWYGKKPNRKKGPLLKKDEMKLYGKHGLFWTIENYEGQVYQVKRYFRMYPSVYACLMHHSRTLKKYKLSDKDSIEDQGRKLQSGGYASGENYGSKVSELAKRIQKIMKKLGMKTGIIQTAVSGR